MFTALLTNLASPLVGGPAALGLDLQVVLLALLNIIVIDLVLSGDNAIVIGMAVRALPPPQRRVAILFGGGAALVLRVIFTVVVTIVIRERPPFVLAVGGLILVWITYRLLTPEKEEDETTVNASRRGRGFLAAISTIIVADVTMSLDNVLAVGVAAQGDPALVLVGLILSMAILVAGGALVASILNRLPWLNYVGGLILLVLVGDMIAGDPAVESWTGDPHWWLQWVITGCSPRCWRPCSTGGAP